MKVLIISVFLAIFSLMLVVPSIVSADTIRSVTGEGSTNEIKFVLNAFTDDLGDRGKVHVNKTIDGKRYITHIHVNQIIWGVQGAFIQGDATIEVIEDGIVLSGYTASATVSDLSVDGGVDRIAFQVCNSQGCLIKTQGSVISGDIVLQ